MNTHELSEKALQLFANTNFELISEYLLSTMEVSNGRGILAFCNSRQSFLGEQTKLTLLSEANVKMMIVLLQELHYELFINQYKFECVLLARYADESFVINFHMPILQFDLLKDTVNSLSEEAHYWRDGQNMYP